MKTLEALIEKAEKALEEKITQKRTKLVRDVQRSINANSLDVIITSKPKTKQKDEKKEILIPYLSNLRSKNEVVVVECPSEVEVKAMSVTELLALNESKSKLKKLLKESILVIPPQKAPLLLKNFGKMFQKYKKAPVVLSQKITASVFNEIQNKEFLRIYENVTCAKVGSIKEDKAKLLEKILIMVKVLLSNDRVLTSLKLKYTQGPCFAIEKVEELNELTI